MKKYMVIYHAPEDFMAQAAKCGNRLIDLGNPLMGGQKILPDGNSQSSTRGVAGDSILQAADMDDVKSLLVDHPHLAWNAAYEIEVHEVMPLPG